MAIGKYLGIIVGVVGAIVGGVIGGVYGGPAGAFTGASLGFSIGGLVGGVTGSLFWPEKTDLNLAPPPQPHETRLQFSSWGMPIPIQYGAGRLAGNIIYMSDITETIQRSKHRQDGVRYYEMVKTYTATFAVAFCERVNGIGRIWINNKIFVDYRDPYSPLYPSGDTDLAEGNLDTSIARQGTFFSIHFGTESQSYDQYMAAIIGATETPAYRGTFYITFIDFPIGEFSGVPTIEVEVEEGMVDVTTTQDGTWTAGGSGIFSFTSIALNFGLSSAYECSIIRFANLRIHQNQEISTAVIRWTCAGVSVFPSRTVGINIKGVAADNPTMPTTYYELENLTYCAAVVNYSGLVGSKTVGEQYDTPDIKSIIQELVNRPGWQFGNSIEIVFRGDGGSNISSFWTAASADSPTYDTPLQLLIT